MTFLCVLGFLFFWIQMISIIKKNGEYADYFFVSGNEFAKLTRIIENENNINLKSQYKKILVFQKVFIFLAILFLILSFNCL